MGLRRTVRNGEIVSTRTSKTRTSKWRDSARTFTAALLATLIILGGTTSAQSVTVGISGTQTPDVYGWGTARTNTHDCNSVQLRVTSAGTGLLTIGLRNAGGAQYAKASSGTIAGFPWVPFWASVSTRIPQGTFYLNSRVSWYPRPAYWSADLSYNVWMSCA